jgi:hypothetical protein
MGWIEISTLPARFEQPNHGLKISSGHMPLGQVGFGCGPVACCGSDGLEAHGIHMQILTRSASE